MNKALFVLSGLLLLTLAAGPSIGERFSGNPVDALSPRQAVGGKILTAVDHLIGSLDPKAREKALFAWDDAWRLDWHFIPRERKGLPLTEMSLPQRARTEALLQVSLSQTGYETSQQVRYLEGVLRQIEGKDRRFPREPDLYFISIFGKPAKEGRWAWRFEGHHLCLSFAFEGERLISATPLFFGANPALVPDGSRKGLRVLADTEDSARRLIESLSAGQRNRAVGKGKPVEVESMQKARYDGDLPAGVRIGDLDESQKKIYRTLVDSYVVHQDVASRDAARRTILADENAQFAWRGGIEPLEGHSYIVHGESFVISYSNFQNGAQHVHALLRLTGAELGDN